MKTVEVTRDAKGNVIASLELDPGDDGIQGEAVLEEGQTLETLNVPNSYILDIDDFCEKCRIKK